MLFGADAEVGKFSCNFYSTQFSPLLGDYFRTIPQRSKAELSTACGVNTSVTIGKKTVQLQLDKPIAVGELVVRREDAGHILLKSDSDEVRSFLDLLNNFFILEQNLDNIFKFTS